MNEEREFSRMTGPPMVPLLGDNPRDNNLDLFMEFADNVVMPCRPVTPDASAVSFKSEKVYQKLQLWKPI